MHTNRFAIAFIVMAMLGLLLLFNTGPVNIFKKNLQADLSAGLNRTVTVYSNTGVPIKTWKGRIDLDCEPRWVNMLINGDKRVIIQGGIVVVEEFHETEKK